MEMTQTVSTITEVPVNVITTGTAEEPLTLATIWAELKVERVQDGFAAWGCAPRLERAGRTRTDRERA